MRELDLICTDLDGTVFGQTPRVEELSHLSNLMRRCAQQWRTRWVIATARPMKDLRPALHELLTFGMAPHYVITEDALIYERRRSGGFSPFWLWNLNIIFQRFSAGRKSVRHVSAWRSEIQTMFPSARNMSEQTVDLWLEFDSENDAERAEIILRDRVADTAHFDVFRWGCELFLAPAAGTKGQALRKLMSKLGIDQRRVLAIGDGPNDISMLDGSAAGLPACVGNALPHVKDVVTEAGGYVCENDDAGGVIEALQICVGS